jgi:hypothetical protein
MAGPHNPPAYNPSQAAIANWKNQVALLEPWEQEEIDRCYQMINSMMRIYQASAMLAVTRAALEIGQLQGQ